MSGPRVLVVDDSPVIRSMAALRLRAGGFEVTVVATITEMASALAERVPDAVLLDIMMPEMLGSDLVSFVRTRTEGRALVALFSGLNGEQLKQHVADSGADGAIRKVAGLTDLVEELNALLGGRPTP